MSLNGEKFNVGKMYTHVEDDKEINEILDLDIDDLNKEFKNPTQEAEYFEGCLLALANEYIQGRLEYLKNAYNKMTDSEEKRKAVLEITALGKKLKSKSISEKL